MAGLKQLAARTAASLALFLICAVAALLRSPRCSLAVPLTLTVYSHAHALTLTVYPHAHALTLTVYSHAHAHCSGSGSVSGSRTRTHTLTLTLTLTLAPHSHSHAHSRCSTHSACLYARCYWYSALRYALTLGAPSDPLVPYQCFVSGCKGWLYTPTGKTDGNVCAACVPLLPGRCCTPGIAACNNYTYWRPHQFVLTPVLTPVQRAALLG